jgi:trimethylamine---corrinoid protein Co-methyltransferase
MPTNLKLTVLNPGEINRVHQTTLDLISTIGVKVEGAKAMALLTEAGCKRNSNGNFTFTADLLEYALKKAPREIRLYNTTGTELINLGNRSIQYFGTH